MLHIQEYEVEPSNKDELMKMYEDSKEIFNELDLPFLKDYTVYQSKENPRKVIGVCLFDESGSVERLMGEYMKHPNAASIVERAQSLMVEDSYKEENYEVLFPF